jgi:hypothetical protein
VLVALCLCPLWQFGAALLPASASLCTLGTGDWGLVSPLPGPVRRGLFQSQELAPFAMLPPTDTPCGPGYCLPAALRVHPASASVPVAPEGRLTPAGHESQALHTCGPVPACLFRPLLRVMIDSPSSLRPLFGRAQEQEQSLG